MRVKTNRIPADLTGKQFGKLTVLQFGRRDKFPERNHSVIYWLCRCECGTNKEIRAYHLTSGAIVSCGCFSRAMMSARMTRHGDATRAKKHPLYATWKNMRQRCNNGKSKHFRNYGARGISVCSEWDDFSVFRNDMEPDWIPGLKLERIDNNGPYSPGNCRWATQLEQCNNTRRNRTITWGGQTHTITEWSRITGINDETIRARIELGWSPGEILFLSVDPFYKHQKTTRV